VFDRWFYVTGFIPQVLAVGFARVVTQAQRDIPYTDHGQTCPRDPLWRLVPAKRFSQSACLKQKARSVNPVTLPTS
jgi:hypothetical protein